MKKQFKTPKVSVTPLMVEQLLAGSGVSASAEGLSSGSDLNPQSGHAKVGATSFMWN